MNIITLIGRTTDSIELKKSQNDKFYARFTVAVNRRYDKEKTDFINCVAFNKAAELISQYVKKGNKVMISGELHIDKSQAENENKYYTSVAVENFEFLESKKETENGQSNVETKKDEFPF